MTTFFKFLMYLTFVTMLHKTTAQKIAFAIHGGAGTILRQNISEQQEKEIKEDLYKALKAGYEILEKGGTALDAIEIAIRILEDSPLFNAGKGSVIAANGKIEMDASIMDGKTLRAGSVAGVRTIKNPITAARAVMEKSKHVMLTGKGAEEFAEMHGIEITDPSYFFINKRIEQLKEAKESEWRGDNNILYNDHKYGTVGAVALDKYGNLAAGTSTGGMTNKKFGRVGDSPIIGAGTYADNRSCAVSCTGHGEYFIRYTVARTVAALVEYKRWSLKKALHYVLFEELLPNGGRGGIIAVDKNGNISTQFNTEGMYRAWIDHKGNYEIKIYE